jgi:phosphodiesterase/alkaline phosphatase D-like protein
MLYSDVSGVFGGLRIKQSQLLPTKGLFCRKPTKEVFHPAGRHQTAPAATAHIRTLNCVAAL